MENALRARPWAARFVCAANTWITRFVYTAYPCLLIWLCASGVLTHALVALIIPALGFGALTALRKAVNAPRPYELFKCSPVIPKNTQGLSFPSRHTFSIFVIATTFAIFCPAWIGVLAYVLACALGALRIIGGVHFPRDVFAAALLGIAVGALELLFL